MGQTFPGLWYRMTTLDTKPGGIREELRPKMWFMVTRSLTFQMLSDMAPAHFSNDKYLLLSPSTHHLSQNHLITDCFLDIFLRLLLLKTFISLCLQGLVKYPLPCGTFSGSLAGRNLPSNEFFL